MLIDLDIDSQTDGANAVMSGLDSESESDVPDGVEPEDEPAETVYVHSPEEEFGAVSEHLYSNFVYFKNNFFFRLASKLRNWPKSIRASYGLL